MTSRPLRVLVVDDHEDTVTTLVSLLRVNGYEARGHRSAMAALNALRPFKPDVVISDIGMPRVNGWLLAREVRRRIGNMPVLIAVTGKYTKSVDQEASRESGFDHYLIKPVDANLLMKLIEDAISGRTTA